MNKKFLLERHVYMTHPTNVKSVQEAMNGLGRPSVRDKYKVKNICDFPIMLQLSAKYCIKFLPSGNPSI